MKDRRIQQLRQVDVQRKQVIEELQEKLTAAKQESNELSFKFGAQRVRNKNMQDEVSTLKNNARSLNEKSVRDDGIIADLNVYNVLPIYYKIIFTLFPQDQIANLHDQLTDKVQLLKHQADFNLLHDQENLRLQQALQSTVDEQSADIAGKSSNIEELRQQLARVEDELKSACGEFLFNCRDLRKDEYMAILDVLQAEKECLLGQVKEMNGRLTKERERIAELHESLRKQNVKYVRLEFKYSKYLTRFVHFVSVIQYCISDECIKEQSSLKDRYRRTQRISDYSKYANPSVSTLSINSSSSSVNSVTNTAATTEVQFQLNLQLAELKNK